MATLYYPTTKDFTQGTLGAELLEGVTAAATLNTTATTLGIQNLPGVMIIDRVDANNVETATKVEVVSFTATSGSTVTTCVRGLAGTTDQDHAVGAIVEFGPDVIWAQGLIDTLLVEHNTTGTHKTATVTTLKATGAVVTTGTSDVTIVTPKALKDAGIDVTASSTTTFTNKTLTSPVINTPTIATPVVRNYDGWIDANETWTYASASTITIPAGGAAKYAVGDRIKWTQTTVKYGVIVTVADTLLTIAVNTDYVVANAAITLNYYSHEASPIGYPQWFALAAPTFDVSYYDNGSGAQPTTTEHRMSINGRTVTVHYHGTGVKAGTNNLIVLTATSMTAPANTTILGPLGTATANLATPCLGIFCLTSNPYLVNFIANISNDVAITDFAYEATYEI